MTAVEWLEQQLFNKLGKFTKGDIDKAKEMEKQQQDDFAIGFAEWLRGYRYDNAEIYHMSSTKELLEIYKEEKGL